MSRKLLVNDLVVIAAVVFVTQYFWLGIGAEYRDDLPYALISIAIVLAWTWSLGLNDSRSHRILGTGWTEYLRVASGSLRLFGAIAIIAYLAKADLARGFFLLSLPIGVAAVLLERFVWRRWLLRQRVKGEFSARVVVVGSSTSVTHLVNELRRAPRAGFTVVGACLPDGERLPVPLNVPVFGTIDSVPEALRAAHADTVAIASTDELPTDKVKQISWALEAGREHLVLAPNIIDIAGPRMHIRPVAGLPLIHVETPRFSSGQRLAKRMFDMIGSLLIISVLSPALLAVGLAVKLTSKGPVLYRQTRIGQHGEEFRMLKFRSMRVGADDELKSLLDLQGTSDKPLFKVKNDPRITPVGKFIRRYSLDELPQLFNVLGGSMSLVGPRPQVAREVAEYTEAHHRRLLIKPGITGLWQVSGRSELSLEESIRLDLRYVENWSLITDLTVIMKTVGVVVRPSGAF